MKYQYGVDVYEKSLDSAPFTTLSNLIKYDGFELPDLYKGRIMWNEEIKQGRYDILYDSDTNNYSTPPHLGTVCKITREGLLIFREMSVDQWLKESNGKQA